MPDRLDQAPRGGPAVPASQAAHQPADARRRRREGLIILLTALAVVAFALFETRLPQFAGSGSLGHRRHPRPAHQPEPDPARPAGLPGGPEHREADPRPPAAHPGLASAHPAGGRLRRHRAAAGDLLFLVAQVFLSNSIERWFNGQVERALEGSLDVAHAYYEDLAATSLGFARETATQLAAQRAAQARQAPRAEGVPRRAPRRVPARPDGGVRRRPDARRGRGARTWSARSAWSRVASWCRPPSTGTEAHRASTPSATPTSSAPRRRS